MQGLSLLESEKQKHYKLIYGNTVELGGGDDCTPCEKTKSHRTVRLNVVNFMGCEFRPNKKGRKGGVAVLCARSVGVCSRLHGPRHQVTTVSPPPPRHLLVPLKAQATYQGHFRR